LKPYEALIILNPAMTEDKVDAAVGKFEKKLKDCGVSEINTSRWGLKKLAFKMKKATEGFYVMINFSSESKAPNELRDLLNVSEDVIRYSIVCAKLAEKEVKEEKVEIEPSMIIASPIGGQASPQ